MSKKERQTKEVDKDEDRQTDRQRDRQTLRNSDKNHNSPMLCKLDLSHRSRSSISRSRGQQSVRHKEINGQ